MKIYENHEHTGFCKEKSWTFEGFGEEIGRSAWFEVVWPPKLRVLTDKSNLYATNLRLP